MLKIYKGKFNEDSVKAGISKYVRKNLDKLEIGLKITHEEKPINEQNRPDFLAKDKNGISVIIECKGYADNETIKQIKRYRSNYPKSSRCFLIATQLSDDCKKEARRNEIEVFEVDLNFNKITSS
jgi:RecB family endonuclease NucS